MEETLETLVAKASGCKSSEEILPIIESALESPKILVFGELLDVPQVKQLADTEYKKHLEVLKLFAYGTLKDFNTNPSDYPALTDSMLLKLKHLTVATLAGQSRSLKYSSLMSELGLTTRRELEDLVIEAIYARIVTGKLDQRRACFEVDQALARDVPADLSTASRLLNDWCTSCEATLAAIEKESDRATQMKVRHQERLNTLENHVQLIRKAQLDGMNEEPIASGSGMSSSPTKHPKSRLKLEG